MTLRRRRTHPSVMLVAIALGATLAISGCVSHGTYVSRAAETQNKLELVPSKTHEFSFVRLDESDGVFTLYGKVRHLHDRCEQDAHVDMTVHQPGRGVLKAASLPLRNRGTKRPGWRGAAFRVKHTLSLPEDAVVRLAFHDPLCSVDGTFDCGGNAALPNEAALAGTKQ